MPRSFATSRVLNSVCAAGIALGACSFFIFPTSAAQPVQGNLGPQGQAALNAAVQEVALQIKVLDPSGKPQAGTQVGFLARNDASQGEGWTLMGGVVSNAQGTAVLKAPENILEDYSLVSWNPEAKLCAIQSLDLDDLEKPVTVKLKPQCRLQGRVASKQLEQAGLTGPIYAQVFHDDHEALQFVIPRGKSEYEFYLPAGEFELSLMTEDSQQHVQTVRIAKGKKQQKLNDVDLPATHIALLRGRPAPELSDVVGWKNSESLSLAQLHGKVVILDFWGYWCGPCVKSMPAMMQLHDRYSKQGLVIIGVHVPRPRDGVTTVQALDRNIAGVKQSIWNGRDLPFPVAITKFQETAFGHGFEGSTSNHVAADYGVDRFPSAILIDRRGNVVKKFSYDLPQDIALLQQLISEKPSTVSAR